MTGFGDNFRNGFSDALLALGLAWQKRTMLFRLCALPAMGVAVLTSLIEITGEALPLVSMMLLIALPFVFCILTTLAETALLRALFGHDERLSPRQALTWRPVHWIYLKFLLINAGIIIVVALLIVSFYGVVVALGNSSIGSLVGAVALVVLVIGALCFWLRLRLMFPLAALERTQKYVEAWRASIIPAPLLLGALIVVVPVTALFAVIAFSAELITPLLPSLPLTLALLSFGISFLIGVADFIVQNAVTATLFQRRCLTEEVSES